MKRKAITWTEPAVGDLEKIIDYAAEESGFRAATSLHAKVFKMIESLAHLSSRGRVVPELKAHGLNAYRELIMRPYRLIYRIDDGRVVLLAIVDGRRDLQELLLERALR
jgi:toxin ParE1/3/4